MNSVMHGSQSAYGYNIYCHWQLSIKIIIVMVIVFGMSMNFGFYKRAAHSKVHSQKQSTQWAVDVIIEWLARRSLTESDSVCNLDQNSDSHFHYTFHFDLRMENQSKQVRNGTSISKCDIRFESVLTIVMLVSKNTCLSKSVISLL